MEPSRLSRTHPRAITTKVEGLARVDGSARFAFGKTAALASISGPIEVRIAAELPSTATFEVLHRPLSNIPGTQSKVLASSIRAALLPSLILTQNPRTLVQLVVQSLGSKLCDALVASMVNASTLALLSAGSVPMRSVVCAVAVGRTKDGAFVVDPSEDDVGLLQASGCFAFAFGQAADEARCVWTNWRSLDGASFSEKDLSACRKLGWEAAQEVRTHIHGLVGEGEPDEEMEEEVRD
ncbi:Exosome component Rrp46 [Mycena kentingensis (nom. inval.)]|nr:Exosome component Rrp46 [Mycena kentingensis (nom. inval.)]